MEATEDQKEEVLDSDVGERKGNVDSAMEGARAHALIGRARASFGPRLASPFMKNHRLYCMRSSIKRVIHFSCFESHRLMLVSTIKHNVATCSAESSAKRRIY
jgi:hypothetical protein